MNYWVTTHYPSFIDMKPVPPGVFIRNRHKGAAKELNVGDKVIVYETTKSPRYKNFRRYPGRGKVIYYGTVRGAFQEINEYPDSKEEWSWFAPVQIISDEGTLPYQELLSCLSVNSLRGIGKQHCGLMKIEKEQYENIVQRFHQR